MYTSLDLEKVKQMSVDCYCDRSIRFQTKRARDVIIGALIVWRHYTEKDFNPTNLHMSCVAYIIQLNYFQAINNWIIHLSLRRKVKVINSKWLYFN